MIGTGHTTKYGYGYEVSMQLQAAAKKMIGQSMELVTEEEDIPLLHTSEHCILMVC